VKIRVVLEYHAEAGAYAAYCPELPGFTSAGETEEEALRNIREAIELYLEPTGDVGKGGIRLSRTLGRYSETQAHHKAHQGRAAWAGTKTTASRAAVTRDAAKTSGAGEGIRTPLPKTGTRPST
jgi:predicted RNase H-like HicB family nuclease